jgi:hypothetical protein
MVRKELSTEMVLDQFYQRLLVLEQELGRLKNAPAGVDEERSSGRTFASLRGVWSGVDLSLDDIAKAHIKAPDL